ncbi:MAG: MoaD/ThiS family protein [Actinomycetota bacterium]|nr:MoaD/ThiS family protein [Actinomycetota bacterium]
MATVTLRAPLRDRVDGQGRLDVEGATVGEVLRSLERSYPRIAGWILDDQGKIRRHVNVFVNGERAKEGAPLAPSDVVQVLPSISGGSAT